ncbi:hypothetical protein [Mycoplasma feriruminatoris]|uniref:Lipoprotein n=1 Tax=Mycoplasma feriruminatoris TaxID=1179777 RepID=A0AAX3TG97_9MOLU|nr:hypothetical protein [Mycoplasma feriruminatoris]WFQ92715.1 hypothetical protein MFERI14822_00504 [Mycoplasma feriruminatoris]
MKKFLTILSFLTTLSSSLVVVACKTDNVDKEVKNKENKNEQNNNPKDNKQNQEIKNTNNNNLREKQTENQEKKLKPKEEKKNGTKSEKSVESEAKPNNTLVPNDNSNNQGNFNNGTLNNNSEDSPKNEMPNDEPPRDENQKEVSELKAKLNDALDKMDNMKIRFFFQELYSNIVNSEFNKISNELILKARKEIPKLFKKYKFETLKHQVNIFISSLFDKNYKWAENGKLKLNKLLTNIGKEEDFIDEVELLISDLLTDELQNKQKEAISEIEKLIKDKNYSEIKQKLYKLIDKLKDIEKAPLISNF